MEPNIFLNYSELTASKLNEIKDTYMSFNEKLNNKLCETATFLSSLFSKFI